MSSTEPRLGDAAPGGAMSSSSLLAPERRWYQSTALLEEEREQRRLQTTILRQEVAALLRMHSSLQAKINEQELSRSGSLLVRQEEHRAFEARARRLAEECQWLDPERGPTASLVALQQERDELRQRLQAMQAAQGVRYEAEQQQRFEPMRGEEEPVRWPQKPPPQQPPPDPRSQRPDPLLVEGQLRAQLAEDQVRLDAAPVELPRRSGRPPFEQDYGSAHVECHEMRVANEALRRELQSMKEQMEAQLRNRRGSETELAELQAQLQLQTFDLRAQVAEKRRRAAAAESELAEEAARLNASEAALSAARAESRELQSRIDRLEAECGELRQREQQGAARHSQEVAALEVSAATLAAERDDTERQLRESEAARSHFLAFEAESVRRCDDAALEAAQRSAQAADICRLSEDAVLEAEQRIEGLTRELCKERRRNADLEREVVAVRHGRSGDSTSPRRRSLSEGRSGGWTAVTSQMHRELELLRRWKGEALETLRRTQQDMSHAQRQYRHQLEYNRQLQERLERIGQQARTAISRGSGSSPPVSPSSPLPAPSPPHAPPRHASLAPSPPPPLREPAAPLPVPPAPASSAIATATPVFGPSAAAASAALSGGNVGVQLTPPIAEVSDTRADEMLVGGGRWRGGDLPGPAPLLAGTGAAGLSSQGRSRHGHQGSLAAAPLLAAGPDFPEAPDPSAAAVAYSAGLEAAARGAPGAAWPRQPLTPRGTSMVGPVPGPFYEAYRAAGGQLPPRGRYWASPLPQWEAAWGSADRGSDEDGRRARGRRRTGLRRSSASSKSPGGRQRRLSEGCRPASSGALRRSSY